MCAHSSCVGARNIVNMNENGLNVKKLMVEAKEHLKLEINYGKLTAVEKVSIIMSRIALIAVLTIIGSFAMFYVSSTIVELLVKLTEAAWAAYLIMSVLMLILMGVVFAFRKQWIIDPITRFVSKLFLNPNDNE